MQTKQIVGEVLIALHWFALLANVGILIIMYDAAKANHLAKTGFISFVLDIPALQKLVAGATLSLFLLSTRLFMQVQTWTVLTIIVWCLFFLVSLVVFTQ